ncbi:MAG TPA: hypothetical protein VG253_23550 [Streptosporangiaceae bacterium]|nr:hypothetical protein [Streptosporangiaceae bacterium]
MLRRITRTLIAAAAAGVTATTLGFAAGGAASAATTSHHGTTLATIANRSAAGYEASGRNFRYIAAMLTVPDFPSNILFPQEYIQLSNGSLGQSGDQYVRAGIESCVVAKAQATNPVTCATGSWVSYVEAFDNSVSSFPTPYFFHAAQLSGVSAGDGVHFSIYFDQPGNELHFQVTPPSTSGPEADYKTQAYGPLYNYASALDDFTNSTGQPIPLPPFLESFRINYFLQGAITTYSGAHGSFVGPWETSRVVATSNGLPFPSGHVRVSPNPLWSDGMTANGAVRPWDAFSVWARV